MMPIPVHLMRHGAPERTGVLLGRTDTPVTREGAASCRRFAARFAFEAIVASDLLRSVACAEAIAADRDLPVRIDPRWRELDFGAWDGLTADAVEPGALARFYDDPDTYCPPDGERWSALVARVTAALAQLTVPTLVITHGGAMRAALAQACGVGLRGSWAFNLPYASVLSLELWQGTPTAQIAGLHPCAG